MLPSVKSLPIFVLSIFSSIIPGNPALAAQDR
jgi:hypothetical protein